MKNSNNIIMSHRLNRIMLTTHITTSVGWFGAVTVFFVLAVTGISTASSQLATSSYLAMELCGWYVIIPFCLASLITGIIQAVGSWWGLFKHYWIVVKLILTLFATIALLLHMKLIGDLSLAASGTTKFTETLHDLKIQVLANAGAATLLLIAIVSISVFKPWGKIKISANSTADMTVQNSNANKSLKTYFLIAIILLFVFVIVKHLLSGGMGHH